MRSNDASHAARYGVSVVKNIVLVGFGHITLLDLDTIDLSNLNRQFLFRKKDVKQSKAVVSTFQMLFDARGCGFCFMISAT